MAASTSNADLVQRSIKRMADEGVQHLAQPYERFHCSGVLPFCTWGSSTYFLLGKTRVGKLLTFTGKSEAHRENGAITNLFESPCTTAAREMYEESLGSILTYEQCLEGTRACGADRIMVGSSPKGTIVHTFLVEVPYRKHYSTCFAKARAFLNFIDVRDHHLCEFSELKGVCADTLNTKIKNSWRHSGMITSESQWNKIARLSQPYPNLPGASFTSLPQPAAEPIIRTPPPGIPQPHHHLTFAAAVASSPVPPTDWRARVRSAERPQSTTHHKFMDEDDDDDML